ncbi:MAG: hypothetical protein ACHQIG_04915 [Acidimicrobiia bacterium]
MTGLQERAQLTDVVDEALQRFRGRDLVASVEIVDVLLDIRLLLLDPEIPDEALQELLDEPAPTAASN